MVVMARSAGDDIASRILAAADGALAGRIAVPGRGEQVRAARAFVAGILSSLSGPAVSETTLETARLLTSELVTNAIRHSRSGDGGSVTLTVRQLADGIGVEVTDDGAAGGTPVVKDDVYTCDGHGLFLVEALADDWGYRQSGRSRTTVWFRLHLH